MPQLPAGQLVAENNFNRPVQPAGQAASSLRMDQQLSANVRLENKLSLWMRSCSQCFRCCILASFSLVVSVLRFLKGLIFFQMWLMKKAEVWCFCGAICHSPAFTELAVLCVSLNFTFNGRKKKEVLKEKRYLLLSKKRRSSFRSCPGIP